MNYAKLLLWIKEKWYYFAILGAAILVAILYKVLHKTPTPVVLDKAMEELHNKLANLRIEAALEIGRAQGKESQVIEEVQAISNLPTDSREDRLKQLQQLSDLINRTR